MTALEYYYTGVLKDMFNKGLITLNVYLKFQMYETYSNYLNKHKHTDALAYTAMDFRVSDLTVRRAIKLVES